MTAATRMTVTADGKMTGYRAATPACCAVGIDNCRRSKSRPARRRVRDVSGRGRAGFPCRRRTSPEGSAVALRGAVRHRISMADSANTRVPILAAGGIVFRKDSKPRIAIVRLRRNDCWVLPKGKLHPGEHPRAAAKREVQEETGHQVSVHGFLGSMSYPVGDKIKIVQFWHMVASGRPVRELMDDVTSVKWLSLKRAIGMLSRSHERSFLAKVGPIAIESAKQSVGDKSAKTSARNRNKLKGGGQPAAHA